MRTDGILRSEDAVDETCPWWGKPVSPDSLTTYRGDVVGLRDAGCLDQFEKASLHVEDALTRLDTHG